MVELSPDLFERCYNVLRKCSEFDNHRSLQAVFVTTHLRPYRDSLPGAGDKATRVSLTVDYLLPKRTDDDQSAFAFFLTELARRQPRDNGSHHHPVPASKYFRLQGHRFCWAAL